jgi:glycosyltransferase involved in cell wall biosynthesis
MDQQGELAMPHTFHVVALPHTQTTKAHCGCAYTQKVLNFCKMMHERGHTVYHYGAEGSLPQCAEHVTTISLEEQRLLYGDKDFRTQMYDVKWDSAISYWALANARATAEIKKRCKPTDFLCLIGGSCQKMIADELAPQQLLVVEFGVGYSGTFAPFCVYESYAHAANRAGTNDPNGKFTDAVIPNYYDAADFPMGTHASDYYLYVGRIIIRKGVQVAIDTCNAIGARLLIAGHGAVEYTPSAEGKPAYLKGTDAEFQGNFEFVGFADVARRASLMGDAKAVFVPTLYLEPFGGVNVEAQLCGTPVITTDWGAFPETVEHGKTGYRCRSHEQFCWAARNVHKLDPAYIRERAVANWGLERVGSMYEEYFYGLSNLAKKGYYEENPGRAELNWLTRRA